MMRWAVFNSIQCTKELVSKGESVTGFPVSFGLSVNKTVVKNVREFCQTYGFVVSTTS